MGPRVMGWDERWWSWVSRVARDRRAAHAALVLGMLGWALAFVVPNWNEPGYDLSGIAIGAKLAEEGRTDVLYSHNDVFYNLADSSEFMRVAGELGVPKIPTAFVHAPLVAALARPLVWVPFPIAFRAWTVLSALALALALAMALRAFAPSVRGTFALGVLMLAMLPFEPALYSFWLGQTTPFIVLMVLGALVLLRGDQEMLAGALMAVPAFIKLTPLVFIPLWAWQRRWRALAGMGVGMVGLAALSVALLGARCHVAYVERVAEIGRIALVAHNNQTLSALLTRPGFPSEELDMWRMVQPSLAARTAVPVLGLFMAAWPVWALRRDRRSPVLEGVALLATLLLPSIAWTHYYVLLVPVALVAVEHAMREGTRGPRWPAYVAVSLVVLCMRPLAPDGADFQHARGLVLVGPTLAALGLTALMCYLAFDQGRSGPARHDGRAQDDRAREDRARDRAASDG